MKILYLTNLPSPYRVKFFSELGKLCELTVIYERKSASDRDSKWHVEADRTYTEVYLEGYEIGTDNSCNFKILKYLNKSYDHVVVGMYSTVTAMIAIEYMKLRHIPFVISTDGGFIKEESTAKFYLKKHFISAANAWLSTGKATTDYFTHYGAKLNRIFCYPFTSLYEQEILKVPLSEEQKCLIRSKLGMTENKIILTVGRFIPSKGFDILLKACAGVDSKIGIYIVGGKPTKEYLSMQKDLELSQVHFVDFMRKEDLNWYYKASDLFVLPTRTDVWGLVINEAMAYGLPVITTNSCIAGRELVEKGINGYLYEAEDINELNRLMTLLCSDNNDFKKMGLNSLQKIKSYTIENMAKVCHNILADH